MNNYEQNLDIAFRKKKGIFYSPNFITKFIVSFIFENYLKLFKDYKFEAYKNLKIIDISCGTGVFLLETFDYLLDFYTKKFPNKNTETIKNHIIEHNLYGIDLDKNAVDICKNLLLERSNFWSQNIYIGNSLISDSQIDERAFDWTIFSFDFDIIVGNPPYGAYLSPEHTEYIKKNYQSAEYQINTYIIFYEKALSLLKTKGFLGYITPNTFTYQNYFKKIRTIFSKYSIECIKKHQYQVFPDANIGDTVSWIMRKMPQNEYLKLKVLDNLADDEKMEMKLVKYTDFIKLDGTYDFEATKLKIDFSDCKNLGELVESIVMGVKAYQEGKGNPKQNREVVENKPFTSDFQENDTFLQCVNGKDFHKYNFLQIPKMFLSYGEWLAEARFNAPFFESEKIIVRQTADSLICHLDTKKYINLNNVYNIAKPKPEILLKYILAILNSSLMNYIYQNIAQEKGKLFAEVKKVYLEKLPIKLISLDKQIWFVEKVSQILDLETTNSLFQMLQKEIDEAVLELYGIEKVQFENYKNL